jgi:hypothetical protein
MGKEVEILPPIRTEIAKPKPVVITSHVPTLYRGGPLSAKIDAWVWNSQSKAVDALARVNNSEAALANAQTALAINKIKRDDALFALQEAPERRGHELAVRRTQRATELRAYQHRYEIQEIGYMKEVKLAQAEDIHAKATRTHATTVLVDAEQQLEAQREHGIVPHKLKFRKQIAELLDVELDIDERKRAFQRYAGKIDPEPELSKDETVARLYAVRDQLNAAGQDTDQIDAAIDALKAGP